MTPTIVHRYAWPIREAIEQLLGDAAGDCDAWRIRVEGDELVIDVVAPAVRQVVEAPSIETPAASSEAETLPEVPAEPPRKGGPLAQRAGIICGEKGFWRFLVDRCGAVGIDSAEHAAAAVRTRCGVTSRSELDHNADAAENFRKIEGNYRLWLEGF